MKKKIFIAGDVREYDSTNTKAFTETIENYIKNNIAHPTDPVTVITKEPSEKELIIQMPFSTGDKTQSGAVTNTLYRCFFGECASFVPKYSLDFRLNFGPSYPINWLVDIDDIKEYHKKNSNFYHASRYKSLDVVEDDAGLTIKFQF